MVFYAFVTRRYNLGAASGEFKGYTPTEIRTWDKAIFDFPLEIPEGAEFIEEIKNAQDKVVAIVYIENGKKKRRNLNGTVQELEDEASSIVEEINL